MSTLRHVALLLSAISLTISCGLPPVPPDDIPEQAENPPSAPPTTSPSNDDPIHSWPRIERISVPSALSSDQSGNVSFTVEADVGETLQYTLSPAAGGGTFFPLSGTIILSGTTGTFVSQYAPPIVSETTEFEHQVRVTHKAGHSVTTTFKIRVKPPGTQESVRDSIVRIRFDSASNNPTPSDVSKIHFNVAEKDTGKPIYVNFGLVLSEGEWTGVIPFLPRAKALVFTAKAYDSSNLLLFQGQTEQSFFNHNEQVVIPVTAIPDGASHR